MVDGKSTEVEKSVKKIFESMETSRLYCVSDICSSTPLGCVDKTAEVVWPNLSQCELDSDMFLKEKHYVQFGEYLDCMGMFIDEGVVNECYVDAINSPLDFYVILSEYWNEMESFQQILGKHYGVENGEDLPKLSERHLMPGMYVAVYYEKEWQRGQILSYDKRKRLCKIYHLEFGFRSTVDVDCLRLLHKSFFKPMNAQAIHCRLRLPIFLRARGSELFAPGSTESGVSAVVFKEIVFSKVVCVSFRNHLQLDTGEFIWEVDIAIGKRKDQWVDLKGGTTNVAEELVQKLARNPLFIPFLG